MQVIHHAGVTMALLGKQPGYQKNLDNVAWDISQHALAYVRRHGEIPMDGVLTRGYGSFCMQIL